jgi:GTP cyclohydrolase III
MNDIKITLTDLSVNDVNLIMAGLGKLPLEAVVDLWMRLKQQGEAQIKDAQHPDKTA